MDLSTVSADYVAANDSTRLPIAAFDEVVWSNDLYQFKRRVFLKRSDQQYATQRSQQRHAVVQRHNGSPRPLFQAPHRGIAVDAHHERGTELGDPFEIIDMAAVQDVETAVCEYPGAGKCGQTLRELARIAYDLVPAGRQSMYSKSLTTR